MAGIFSLLRRCLRKNRSEKVPEESVEVVLIVETSPDGVRVWRGTDGSLHRDDGVAFEDTNGDAVWYSCGRLHRLDGPALDLPGRREWWVDGVQVTHDTHEVAVEEYVARSGERRVKACRE
jgi:hypothetical protein